jgi:hypothetical protein
MKKTILILITLVVCSTLSAQFVATMEIKEHIEGICNEKAVYALFPMFDGQKEAVCPTTDKEILKRLNNEVKFLKDNPKFKDKGMVSIIINCKGEVVKCEMDNKTKNEDLDEQIVAIFNSLGEWKAGRLNGKKVDTVILYSFKIKKGEISFE